MGKKEKKEKKVGSDGRFMYEYVTFMPSKPNTPSFLSIEYRRVSTTAQGCHNVKG
jgi:hypothetical protein